MTEETVTDTQSDAIATDTPEVTETPTDTGTEEKAEPEKVEPEPKEPEAEKPADTKLAKKSYEARNLKRQNQKLNEEIKTISEKFDVLMSKLEESTKPSAPKLEEFNTVEEYVQATLDYDKKVNQPKEETPKSNDDYEEVFNDSKEYLMELGAEKYDDFESVVTSENARITPLMAEAIFRTENQADIAYYLGKNPKVATKISKLEPMQQAIEIGKLEERYSKPVKSTKKPSAPDPISPVGGGNTQSDEITPTMDIEKFMKVRNKQLGR